jgi:hypothetical protein
MIMEQFAVVHSYGHGFTDLCRVSLALERTAQVVDDNAGSSRAEESGISLS